jgi:hypothetical protein
MQCFVAEVTVDTNTASGKEIPEGFHISSEYGIRPLFRNGCIVYAPFLYHVVKIWGLFKTSR